MKGLDWDGLTEEYAELAARAWTSDEFAEIGMRLMGELSASHLGVTPPSDYSNPDFRSSGRLGIDATPLEDGSWRVDKVLPRLRTNSGEMRLRVGDLITGIELEPLRPGESLDQRLVARAGDETIVTVRRTIAGENGAAGVERSLDLLVTPVSLGEERGMRYDDWQLSNAAKVDEWSNGRIGYLHIRSMGTPDLVEYERDLFAAAYRKEGLIIDVRSNGGGWTTDRVLASLMYPYHAYTISRGADPERDKGYPRDRLFIQRFNGPVNMLCNEKSFSNAEIISHAFKTLKRGTLVGVPTHGSVISTGAFTLVDGTRVRQPFRGWFLPDGTDMENNGAVPDIIVEQTPRDEADGFDRQLKAAVDDLMKRLD
jgi:tricorn protease